MDEIRGADESIVVMMYACVLPKDVREDHPVKLLIEALGAAQQRGVSVRVVLDREQRRDGSEGYDQPACGMVYAAAGVPMRRDEPDRRSHSKLIVIDGQRVVGIGKLDLECFSPESRTFHLAGGSQRGGPMPARF